MGLIQPKPKGSFEGEANKFEEGTPKYPVGTRVKSNLLKDKQIIHWPKQHWQLMGTDCFGKYQEIARNNIFYDRLESLDAIS